MAVGKVTKHSSRNLRTNLSHILVGNKTKTKPTINHTLTHKHTAPKSIYYNKRASELVKLKKSTDNPNLTQK